MFGLFKKKENLLDQQLSKKKPTILSKDIESNTQSDRLEQKNQDLQKSIEAKEKELATNQTATKVAKEEAQVAQKSLVEMKTKLEAKEKELATSQSATKTAKEEAQVSQKSLVEMKTKLEAKEKELATSQSATKTAKEEAQVSQKSLVEMKTKLEAKEKELAHSLTTIQDFQKEIKNEKKKSEQFLFQIEVVLLQLMLSYENLVVNFDQTKKLEEQSELYRDQFQSIKKSLPQGVYFESIKVVKVDGVSAIPFVEICVNNLLTDEFDFNEFKFSIKLIDGHSGILIDIDNKPMEFFPTLIGVDKNQTQAFGNFSTREFRSILTAIGIIEQVEMASWKDVKSVSDLDLNFWRPYIRAIVAQSKKITQILRYDNVALKRVLENSDYEHLWLEFNGLSLGKTYWKKFEIRIGASLIQQDGFSQHPKFEIPLINGRVKPFDSWYAESKDDAGEKLELRFSLEKSVFDFSVWSRLSAVDKEIMLRLIYIMPKVLGSLENQKFMLHRPLDAWIKLAIDSIKVIENYKSKVSSQTPSLDNRTNLSDNKSDQEKINKLNAEVAKKNSSQEKNTANRSNMSEKIKSNELKEIITKQQSPSTKKSKGIVRNERAVILKKRSKS